MSQPAGEHFDAIILGCGMSGLGAGIRLALGGLRTLILERHNAPGGLNGFYFRQGRKYDVGLHAVTNYVPPGVKGTPLGKICRQLRLEREAFALCPQQGSRIAFPGVDLPFTNDFRVLEAAVADRFPAAADGFCRLAEFIRAYDETSLAADPRPARPLVASLVPDPLLAEMLLVPLFYYGNARPDDMDLDQFAVMFKALYLEGFARPLTGVRHILRVLLDKYRELGGQRRMQCGVRRLHTARGRVQAIETDDGTILTATHVFSSIGRAETLRLCPGQPPYPAASAPPGALSFVETISCLDAAPADLGWPETIVFFNDGPRFRYAAPEADLVDPASGVICLPNNYRYPEGTGLPEGLLRITALASHARWTGLPEEEYRAAKSRWFDLLTRQARRFLPARPAGELERRTRATDMFTPRTIERYTGHLGGAVYGSPVKERTGRTALANLYLIGTDQGFLGITGALLSGISMANLHVLQRHPAPDRGP